ncbi:MULTISPECIES: peptidase [unclassified Streptomyces]|uniref:peptidase n=1 Tax=unclassified Streptomyces TaxID=2593676 RepID=UPI001F18917F|nr:MULTISPECIES: peptidase [unclassified Streptomyces]WKX19828.1 peptidase [Streptomyces sp. HUAS CX7]
MKIRRVLATAVAAAVISPVALLSAAPAFADEKPATQQTQKAKPTIEELEQAVERAQKEYDAAVVAVNDAITFLAEDMEADTYPTKAAVIEAEAAAAAAAQAKTEADQAVVDARAELEAAATDEDRAAAQTALDEAEKAAKEAADAKTAADAKATEASTAHDDARVAQARKIGLLKKAKKEAKAKLTDAEKALADAKAAAEEGEENGEDGEDGEDGEEPAADCVPEPGLTAVVTGLPDKVVGGTTEIFSLRVTNGTGETMDAVYPYVGVHAFDVKGLKELDSYLDLEWSTAANPTWRDADLIDATSLGSLKAKASVDVKLRLKVDPDIPAGQGAAFVTADYVNEDGSCGGYPDLDHHEFEILAKSDDGGDTPGKDDDTKDKSDHTTEQGGASTTPVNTSGGSGSGGGSLAHTGSGDALPKVGLAGGAALVLGAGAVLVARRRRTTTES